MKYLRGDLLEGDWDVAIQVCNSYKCFGSGISDEQVFYNLYAMWGLGNDGTPGGRNLTYDHFYDGVIGIVEDARSSTDLDTIVIGLPYLAGCVRAGGSWGIVDAMLQDIENKYQFVEFHVYELENAETIAHSTIPKEIDLVQEDEEMEVPIPREMAIYRWLKGFRLASK